MSYDPTDLNDALAGIRVVADELDKFLTAYGNAVCARVTSEWRRANGIPDPIWRLVTWALGVTTLRGWTKHWHPEIGIADPKRPCSVAVSWVRFGDLHVVGE